MPIDRIVNLEDIIRGKSSVNTSTLDDKVLIKNDGMPTYHFANVVDDFEMKISHVIRGEEWASFNAFTCFIIWSTGWSAPEFAHLSTPKTRRKRKISKRRRKIWILFSLMNFYDEEPAKRIKVTKKKVIYQKLCKFLALWVGSL